MDTIPIDRITYHTTAKPKSNKHKPPKYTIKNVVAFHMRYGKKKGRKG